MAAAFHYADSRRVSRLTSAGPDPHAILAAEIGPAYARYRREWEDARAFKTQPGFPLHVDFELMFRCNLRCPMCLMSLPLERRRQYGDPGQTLAPAKVRELIGEMAENGGRAMAFGGLWEPLLSPHVPGLAAYGRQMGLVDVFFNTNGYFLTGEVGRALLDGGLTRLMVSLDAATAATYDKMRPGSDFGRVTRNIENFLGLRAKSGQRLPLVRLSFCRTAVNEAEEGAFLKRWAGEVDFFSLQTYGRYDSADPPGFPQSYEVPPPGRCAQPHKRLLVRHNGDVLPCCDASGTPLVVGNIHKQSLGEIWRGPRIKELRQRLAAGDLPPACRACQGKFS